MTATERVRGTRVAPRSARPEPAAVRPVAHVAVDLSLAHLDRPFDYLVPEAMAAAAQPGVRVRVRFAGQVVDGFVLERAEASEHQGRLAFLHKIVSAESVLSREVAALARTVADRYAGTLPDVLRLAVPPRHARVEVAATTSPVQDSTAVDDPRERSPGGHWAPYPGGPALLDALRAGGAPRAIVTMLPGDGWPVALAQAAGATLEGGRGVLLVAPDGRDVDRLGAALTGVLGSGRHVVLTAGLGPAERYRRFLAIRRGQVRVVVGTRAAMFAPVADLGLVGVWDDGDDLHAEPRAPYPHVREVLALRSAQTGAGLIVAGHACTAEGAHLVASGWARAVTAPRGDVRRLAPRVEVAGDDAELARDPAARTARLPALAWRTAHEALTRGPVLVQVPRRGYVPALACQACRAPARCLQCQGPLGSGSTQTVPSCRWCAALAGAWECPHCGARRLRAAVVGAGRTAEELGRAFPRVRVRTSGRDGVLASVGSEPALVVATPGAEPVAEGGYAAALLLDGWALLTRPDLRATEEALRRWLGAATLVRPAGDGGRVVVLADPSSVAVQALLRWDPVTFAERELAERAALRLPPAARMASLTGGPDALLRFVATAGLSEVAELLGPVPARPTATCPDAERLIVRVPRSQGRELAASLRAAAGVRSAHKESGSVRVQVDPLEIA